MKFSDGYWKLKPGVTAAHPVEVREITEGPGSLVVHAPAHAVRHRGDLLKGPLITVALSAPRPDVIKVEVTHFAGERERGPRFAVDDGEPGGEVSREDGAVVLTSGNLSVRVREDAWRVEFVAAGEVLTSSAGKGLGFLTVDGVHHVREQLNLGVGDSVYGLGERFGPLVRNGQQVDSWNADGGTATEQAYKNIPFYLTDAGYGVFVNHPGRVSFEVASEVTSKVQFSVEGQSLEYFVVYGPTPKDVLRTYTALTGRPAMPPAWSFGLWLSTSFTTSYDERTVTGFIDGMAGRDLPLSVFHFDCFWMRELHWCDFTWDPVAFPDPAGMLARLKARGLRVSVWINPYIAQRSALFAEGVAGGYLLRKPGGDVWQGDEWQPGMALVDFTNPAAREWYAANLAVLLEQGVDCFKTDFGERIPTDVVYHDGSDPERMHNYYTYLYNETVFELLRERGDAVVFARSATAGSQRFPVHWGGDCEATYEAMAESLRGGLSLGMAGFGFWSHDIGGFEGTPSAALFKRWIAFGLLSSHSRLHGSHSYRVPWLFDEEAVDVLRRFTKLKARLMPYLAQVARQAVAEGVPMMRAMVLEFPDDPACTHLERQYMLGESLLVAPVFSDDGAVSYYVPDGCWTDLLTGRKVRGPRWIHDHRGFLELPVLVRPDTVLPLGAVDSRPDYAYADGVTLCLYELSEGTRTTTVGDTVFVTHRRGDHVRIETPEPPADWQILLVGVGTVSAVTGGAVEPTEAGAVVRPAGGAVTLRIEG
ncbi:alpha-xylosidase [Amycolatopsis sp. NPDC026612]|uniref:alpha-xylosidase n=1 Tax=Amycolatopsis sp. NPDC026612 TaxID=3155466 RepID=UPI0033DB79CB